MDKKSFLEGRRKYYLARAEVFREKARSHYRNVVRPRRLRNPSETKARDRVAGLKRVKRIRDFIVETKARHGNKCSKCGFDKEPKILHFHHLRDKIGNVSEMKGLRMIKEEVKKCILLCPNCHALEHV